MRGGAGRKGAGVWVCISVGMCTGTCACGIRTGGKRGLGKMSCCKQSKCEELMDSQTHDW